MHAHAVVGAREDRVGLVVAILQRRDADADGRLSREHLQGDGLESAIDAVVGLHELGHGLLQEARPKLVLLGGLGEAAGAIRPRALPVGQAVVDGNHLPLLLMRCVEADVIAAVLREGVLLEEGAHPVRVLRQSREGGDQPAVAKVALLNVARGHVLEEARLAGGLVQLVLLGLLADHLARSHPAGHHQVKHLLEVAPHVGVGRVAFHAADGFIAGRELHVGEEAYAGRR
mmetsp:Transcript_62136/g.148099  ORF Transcript_62136/g.148099 Transcript_62136/m.148099 type:complete len:230 (+) Transcript_62136:617-1306(+)